jgi:hypothetical protein
MRKSRPPAPAMSAATSVRDALSDAVDLSLGPTHPSFMLEWAAALRDEARDIRARCMETRILAQDIRAKAQMAIEKAHALQSARRKMRGA